MSGESSSFKFLAGIMVLGVAGFGIHVATADTACDKIERAVSPLSLMGDVSRKMSGEDAGWDSYRIHAASFLAKTMVRKESCGFIAAQEKMIVKEAFKVEGPKETAVTDDEKRRILGSE